MARQMLAVLIAVAALLLTSGMVVAADPGAQLEEPTTNATDAADDAYVTEDGDLILVYEAEQAANGEGNVTVNVDDGDISGFYQETGLDSNVTGSFAALVNRTTISADGSLSAPRPDVIESLAVQIDSTTTESASSSDMDLETTLTLPEDQQGMLALFDSFETSGEIRTTGTTLSTSGNADLSSSVLTLAAGMSDQSFDYQLRSTEEGHVLEVAQDSQVSDPGNWDTEEKVTERLREQFATLEESGDVSTAFTLDEYAFEETEQGAQVQVEYTVEMEGLNQFVRDSIVESFTQTTTMPDASPDIDEEAIREELSDLSIERAGVSFGVDSEGGNADWNVTIENYDGLAQAYFSAMAAQDETGLIENQTERYESQLEAMEAADYGQTVSWEATVQPEGESQITADLSIDQRTDNWEAYVAERADRDLPPIATQELTVDVADAGDRIDGEMSLLFHQDDLYTRTLDNTERQFEAIVEASPETSSESIETAMETVRTIGFEQARMDATLSETEATVEGSASFENLSMLASVAGADLGAGSLERAYVSMSEDGGQMYVRVDGAVEGDADQTALRELEPVSEETNLKLSDEWEGGSESPSLEEVSAMDVEEGTMTETATETETETQTEATTDDQTTEAEATTTSGPGFTAGIAGAALLALVALGRYGRQ